MRLELSIIGKLSLYISSLDGEPVESLYEAGLEVTEECTSHLGTHGGTKSLVTMHDNM